MEKPRFRVRGFCPLRNAPLLSAGISLKTTTKVLRPLPPLPLLPPTTALTMLSKSSLEPPQLIALIALFESLGYD